MTLTLTGRVYDEILAHAKADHPLEACGILIGTDTRPGTADRVLKMVNVEQSPTAFRFDPTAQLAAWQDTEDQGECVVAVYHSHTDSEPYPSTTDIAYAADPDIRHVIISTPDSELRAFRIIDGTVTEENVIIGVP